MKTTGEKIMDYRGSASDFRAFLRKYGYDKVFADLYELYESADLVQKVICYIVACYSRESEYVTMGSVWADVKEQVAKNYKLPVEVYDDLVYLGNYQTYEVKKKPKNRDEFERQENELENTTATIRQEHTEDEDLRVNRITLVISAWLDYENNGDNRHLKMLKDQYEEMMIASSQKLMRAGGGIDFATKAQCRKQATEIKEEIDALEKRIREKDPRLLREGREEIKFIRPETAVR